MSEDIQGSSPRKEVREVHTQLLKCALAIEESRSYWERTEQTGEPPTAQRAFEEYWFGAKSLPWVRLLLANMTARYGAFPEAFSVLRKWTGMSPETRLAICHWHLQLSDPLYRSFSGEYLVERHGALRPEVRRSAVITWVAQHGPSRWTLATRKQMASKLLSAALSAGLLVGRRDPRQLVFPRISSDGLSYLLHLLRGIEFEGTLTDNTYLRSVGLGGSDLEARLRALPSLRYRRNGDVIEFGWRHASLAAWAETDLFKRKGAAA